MKKFLTLFLAVLMGLSVVSVTSFATEVETITKAGDTASFGSYYGKPIEWQALAVDATAQKALLVPKEMVGYRSFNDIGEGVTWENSSIRKWLNNEFYNTAFSEQQKAFILESDLENKANSEYNVGGGATTKDKVFLLSIDEAAKYFSGDDSRVVKVNFTEQQIAGIAQDLANRSNAKYTVTSADAISELTSYNGTTDWWWLRTSGRELTRVPAISHSGSVYTVGNEIGEPYGGAPCNLGGYF
ncbi:MAG: DUF6273 domain-containing protein [Clostridiales bacterium]|jgi:hypothetical protein|nr:DUF6273 domain-containing protein [Clostridiales bacterium]